MQLAAVAPAIQVRATLGAEQLAGLVRGGPTGPAALPGLAVERLDLIALVCDDLVASGERRRTLAAERLYLFHRYSLMLRPGLLRRQA